MKKSIIAITILSLAFGVTAPVFAENTNTPANDNFPTLPNLPAIESAAPQSEGNVSSTIAIDNMTALKARGKALIQQRLRALNRLNQKIKKSKLADADKIILVADIATNIAGLKALAEKISADSDLAALKTDVKSIFDDYRIYAVFLPKINGIMNALLLKTHANKISTDYVAKYAAKIAELKTAGKDVSKLESSLADAKAKIADALAKTQTAEAGFRGLKPSDYPGSTAIITANRKLLRDAQASLKAAQKILAKIRLEIRAMTQQLNVEKKKAELKAKQEKKKVELKQKLETKQEIRNQKKGSATSAQ
jgi:hypothetical protein